MLATIISQQGSTPRGIGTRFVITEKGPITGTIGGGLVEFQVIEAAKAAIKTQKSTLLDFNISQSDPKEGPMVCGGKISILVEFFQADSQNIELFKTLQHIFRIRQKALLIINLEPLKQGSGLTSHAIVVEEKTVFSSLQAALTTAILTPEMKSAFQERTTVIRTIEGTDCWVEALQFPKKLILFGAGHVARPTADFGSRTGFHTTVVDDRESLLSPEHFSNRIELMKVEDFKNGLKEIRIDRDSYVVVTTRGHQYDQAVLAYVLKTDAAYIGMIGSRKKRNTIYGSLLEEGFSQKDLDRVHCPIGLAIGADTPEEIAVSIIAELIQVRAGEKSVAPE